MNSLESLKPTSVNSQAIFAYLLQNPDKVSEFNFKSQYLIGENVQKVFDGALDQIQNHGRTYTKQLIKEVYFKNLRPELYDLFVNPTTPDVEARKELAIEEDKWDAFYDASLSNLQNILSSVHEIIQDCVYYNSTFQFLQNLVIKSQVTEADTPEQLYNEIRSEAVRLMDVYSASSNEKTVYTSPFDPALLVKISDKKFSCSSMELNTLLCGGFTSQNVYGFLTKTAGGKSTLLFSLTSDLIRKGYNVAFVNLEMDNVDANDRIVSPICDISYDEYHNNHQSSEYLQQIIPKWTSNAIGQYSLIVRPKGTHEIRNIDWLKSRIKFAEKEIKNKTKNDKFKFDIVVVDYLYLMDPAKKMLKNSLSHEKYRQVTLEFHEFCQDEDYCGITVFQGNREAERKISAKEKFGLADAGDAYASFRDIECAFSLNKYEDAVTGKDGCLIEPLKTRNYDGEKYGVYMPYMPRTKSYDINSSEKIIVSEEGEKKKKSTSVMGQQLYVADVLKEDESLKNDVGGGIFNALKKFNIMQGANIVKCENFNDIRKAFNELEWGVPIRQDKVKNPDYGIIDKKVAKAVVKALERKNSLIPQPKVGLSPEIIQQFDIFNI